MFNNFENKFDTTFLYKYLRFLYFSFIIFIILPVFNPIQLRKENEQIIVEQEPPKNTLDGLNEEEARAERKRRQRQAQEEFRLKQLMKQQGLDDKQELSRNSSSFDNLLMEIPTQDIMIEATGEEAGKRKSPGPDNGAGAAKRRNSCKSKLDIVLAD